MTPAAFAAHRLVPREPHCLTIPPCSHGEAPKRPNYHCQQQRKELQTDQFCFLHPPPPQQKELQTDQFCFPAPHTFSPHRNTNSAEVISPAGAQGGIGQPCASCRSKAVEEWIGRDTLFLGKRLFKRYIIDQASKIEQHHMSELRKYKHQKNIRRANRMDLVAAIAANEGNLAGKPFVLPASYPGSIRHMRQQYKSSMAVVRYHGKPDYFITMTCNPNWPEIKSALKRTSSGYQQQSADRPDLQAWA